MGYPTEAHGAPDFANVEEKAAFWDTYDFTNFAAETSPLRITVGQEIAERLTVRLDQADRLGVIRRARAKGVGPSTLALMWLRERLHQEAEAEQRP
jgi:hypothetical protein